ncbi:sensor histidine kinase KdpD [Halobacteriovorax sp. HLS]|uniref:sensor histidine kinase n=1 Tax=Halobacteriovorax sp. HLS TaxID=2234000 RepID=UPI000FDC39AE|nr:HAMP domain-containing sensor histidine kinase [Halobacteriovorax sp. HLS]
MKKESNLLLILTSLIIATSTALGAWWFYLLSTYALKLETFFLANPELGVKPSIVRMLKWEISTFIIFMLLLSFSFLIVYLKDRKKTKALQDFFASLTHELKTPLASIRLQSEVITDLAQGKPLENLTKRLIEDTTNLEVQMDKILQLSRLERGGKLNSTAVELAPLINKVIKSLNYEMEISIESKTDSEVYADEFATEIIVKNLIENTKNHSKSKNVKIVLSDEGDKVILAYSDNGTFDGQVSRLGELFYKHDSKKGSGIGLYLIKKFMKLMNGDAIFSNEPSLMTRLYFQRYIND